MCWKRFLFQNYVFNNKILKIIQLFLIAHFNSIFSVSASQQVWQPVCQFNRYDIIQAKSNYFSMVFFKCSWVFFILSVWCRGLHSVDYCKLCTKGTHTLCKYKVIFPVKLSGTSWKMVFTGRTVRHLRWIQKAGFFY